MTGVLLSSAESKESSSTLKTNLPRWAYPLTKPKRYKGAKGGRGSGKSHFFAEELVLACYEDPNLSAVCVREIQKSLKFSAKKLIEDKIRALGLLKAFEINSVEIKHRAGNGVIIFQGLQNHTADSIKSLEGFGICWVEEAQSISARSLELLLPTIRQDNSEIWFSWNPDQPTDPVDKLFTNGLDDCELVHVNYMDNPFCPQAIKNEANSAKIRDPNSYPHIWLGEYNTKSDDQVLADKWRVAEFQPMHHWEGAYYGADWGFSVDPNTLICCYIFEDVLYIRHELYKAGVEINDTPKFFEGMRGTKDHVIRADSARPEIISYMRQHGYPKIQPAEKWKGSVEDGISTLRGFKEIVIHPDCPYTAQEARLWKYKRDRLTDDILPVLIDANNHCWDAIRYALEPITKTGNDLGRLLDLAISNG